MVSKLFKAKMETIVPVLRQAAVLAYHPRWWSGILFTALQRTVPTNLLDYPSMGSTILAASYLRIEAIFTFVGQGSTSGGMQFLPLHFISVHLSSPYP